MKHTKQFKEFVNERVTKYKSYIPSKFKKNSNLDLNDALDALYSLNLDEHDVMDSIRRTIKEQRPDIADNFGDDLIELEGALTRVFDAIETIKNKVQTLSESNYIDTDTDQKAIKKEQKAIAPLKKHLENLSKLLDWWDKYPYADTYSHNMVFDGPAMILNNDLTQLMRKIPVGQIERVKRLIKEGEQL